MWAAHGEWPRNGRSERDVHGNRHCIIDGHSSAVSHCPTQNSSTNTTAPTTNNNGGFLGWLADSAGDALGGAGSAISDTVGAAQQGADDAYRSSLRTILDPLITAMVEVPTFGLGLFDDSPGLHKPTKWPFNQLYPLYVAIQALTGTCLLIAIASGFLKLGYPIQNTYRATHLAVRALKAMVIAVVAHLLIIALLHTMVNGLATEIAPSADELAGGFVKMATTTAVSGFFGANMGKDVIVELAKMWTLIWAALMLFPIISGPFFAVWQFDPKSTLGHLSGTLIWLYFGLLLSKILVAIDLRAAWMLDWGKGPFGPINILLTIAFFWLAFFIPPAVLTAILFGRSRALSTISAYTAGAVSGSYVGRKVSEKGRAAKEAVADRAKEKGRQAKSAAAQRTRTTAQTAKARVSTVAGTATKNRVGHRRRPREPSGSTYSDGSSFSGWRSRSRSTASGRKTAGEGSGGDNTAPSSGTSTAAGSSTSTKTTAQKIREVRHRTRQRGYGTPEDRRRYYKLRDQQKYGEQVEYQQASGSKQGAKRRYGSVGGASTSSADRSAASNGAKQGGDDT
ncbi:hypothetical protein ACFQL7_27635 [Halocatena marina]|uniref:Uncharacterized protein n=1 Tax=Halocatena marina TaxID=2934937 RepID=A0ABD5YV56_9EURY